MIVKHYGVHVYTNVYNYDRTHLSLEPECGRTLPETVGNSKSEAI